MKAIAAVISLFFVTCSISSISFASAPDEVNAMLILNDGVEREEPVYLNFEKDESEDGFVYSYVKAFWGPEDDWFDELEEFEGDESIYHGVLRINIKTLEVYHDSVWAGRTYRREP